jgi:hypothetical protein
MVNAAVVALLFAMARFPYSDHFGDAITIDDGIARAALKVKNMPHLLSSPTSAKVYDASCHCRRVRYQVCGDPESSKLCHCHGCQKLHGAPFEWVSIFHKNKVRFSPQSLDFLYFYSSDLDRGWTADEADHRILPVKVSCSHCRTPVADEGRQMWLAFSTLFGFATNAIPDAFRHSCHLFYSQRCIDLNDAMIKWNGHKDKSPQWTDDDGS